MSSAPRVACLVGSLRKDSYNKRLAKAVEALAGGRLSFTHCEIGDLPLYNQDDDKSMSEAALRLKGELEQAQAVLIISPEYNRGVPGVLKNAMDHASRPYGKNSFAKKPGASIGVSSGAAGTAAAQQQLRAMLLYLDVAMLGQPEVYVTWKDDLIDPSGVIKKSETEEFLGGFVDRYVTWVNQHAV